jgi:amino acid transporter
MVTGGVMIAIALFAFYGLHIQPNTREQTPMLGLMIAGMLWSLFSYRQDPSGEKNFKDYFSVGFRTFIVITLLMAVYTLVFYLLNTGVRDTWIAENSELLRKEGKKMPVEIEENARQLKKAFLPMVLGITVFKYLILGVLVAVVGAGFLSQKRSDKDNAAR